MVLRSRRAHNSLGVVGPVTDIALTGMANGSASLSWSSTLAGKGLSDHSSAEDFDIDLRGKADGGKVLGAGYMQLGTWAVAVYGRMHQFRGVIHALELHDEALSDRAVEDANRASRACSTETAIRLRCASRATSAGSPTLWEPALVLAPAKRDAPSVPPERRPQAHAHRVAPGRSARHR